MRSVGVPFLFSLFVFSQGVSGQIHAVFATEATGNQPNASSSACQPYTGPLSAVSVPVNGSVNLYIQIGAAQTTDLVFQLAAANPAYVAAGNMQQGFLPQVTIPAGQLNSNTFTIYGVTVGATTLNAYLLPDTVDPVISIPAGAWGITNTTGSTQLLDANNPNMSCRDSGTPNISTTPSVLSGCGVPVNGVASDGVNPLLIRTEAGLGGTACYQVTSTGPPDQGTIQTASSTTTQVGSTYYGFSLYTPPDGYGTMPGDSRMVSMQFAFTPQGTQTNTTMINVTTTIVRPPLVLIHGLWSNGASWNSTFLRSSMNQTLYTVFPADYGATNAASFATNQGRVQGFIAEAVRRIRAKQFAATQADVIAHSMGGILTRLYANLSQYNRNDNLNMGDVHRMITLDTPHIGTNFANLLVALHQSTPAPTEQTVMNLTQGLITQGAVCDLAQNSTGIQGLSGDSLKAQALTGTGGPAGTATTGAPYWGGATVFHVRSFEGALTAHTGPMGTGPFVFPQATVNAFRFREMNDAVVPLSSQQGGIGSTVNFPNDLHMHIPGIPMVQQGITDDTNAATTAFNTLDGPVSGLTAGLPGEGSTGNGVSIPPVPGLGATTDAANYTAQCGAGGPMRLNRLDPFGKRQPSQQPTGSSQTMREQARPALTYSPNVTVTSPAAGASFVSGSTLTITVAVDPSITVVGYGVNVSGIGRLDGSNLTTTAGGTTFQASVTLTPVSVGPLTITPEVYDNNQNYILGTPITVVEVYTGVATLTSATLVDHNFLSLLPPATQQLYLTGTYSDGSQFDLSNSLMGTTWTSNNPSVLTVDPNGNVTLLSTGIAVVTVQNGGFTDWATFLVENPTTPLPPANFTSQVTIQQSGLVLNRNTGFFVQTITLTNTSAVPLVGPLYLVVSGIPTGVALIGISGVTANIAPVGSDYFTLPLAGAGLTMLPGQVVKLQFQWLNPNRVPLTDSLAVMRTSVTP
jgi:pimeloyl-ACP methyl ester carboxylesterase